MSRRKDRERAQAGAWAAAGHLVGYLRAGGEPQSVPCSIRLDAGEVCYGESAAGLSQFFGLDPLGGGHPAWLAVPRPAMIGAPAWSGAADVAGPWSRQRPEAALRWRPMGLVPVVVTSRRVMACQQGRWLSWWYSGVRQLVPDLAGFSVAMLFDGDRATRFDGPLAPWLSVLLTRLLYGEILDPGLTARTALPAGYGA